MDNLIKWLKDRMQYETWFVWDFVLVILYSWKLIFYVLMPVLVLWAASNSYIAVENQLELGEQLDRIEKAQEAMPLALRCDRASLLAHSHKVEYILPTK